MRKIFKFLIIKAYEVIWEGLSYLSYEEFLKRVITNQKLLKIIPDYLLSIGNFSRKPKIILVYQNFMTLYSSYTLNNTRKCQSVGYNYKSVWIVCIHFFFYFINLHSYTLSYIYLTDHQKLKKKFILQKRRPKNVKNDTFLLTALWNEDNFSKNHLKYFSAQPLFSQKKNCLWDRPLKFIKLYFVKHTTSAKNRFYKLRKTVMHIFRTFVRFACTV